MVGITSIDVSKLIQLVWTQTSVESNGRNFSGFSGEIPMFLAGNLHGEKSLIDLIGEIDDGIVVTNLFYNNFVNQPEGLCTGLTRYGQFKIENGEIVSSLKNMSWTDNILSIFENVEPASQATQVNGFFMELTITPAVRSKQFNLSSKGKHWSIQISLSMKSFCDK